MKVGLYEKTVALGLCLVPAMASAVVLRRSAMSFDGFKRAIKQDMDYADEVFKRINAKASAFYTLQAQKVEKSIIVEYILNIIPSFTYKDFFTKNAVVIQPDATAYKKDIDALRKELDQKRERIDALEKQIMSEVKKYGITEEKWMSVRDHQTDPLML